MIQMADILVLSQDDFLDRQVRSAFFAAGERRWRLPFLRRG
ncbi:MAG TPA: hypothetical protein VF727_13450 [Allosphingosinicella sp.]|jgi:hypothetical protein